VPGEFEYDVLRNWLLVVCLIASQWLYKQGFTMEAIATQLGVSQQQISKDLGGLQLSSKPPRPKGGRPKGSTKPRKVIEKHSKVVALADAGTPKPEIAKEIGVATWTISKDLKEFSPEVKTSRPKGGWPKGSTKPRSLFDCEAAASPSQSRSRHSPALSTRRVNSG
jgi:hypothetical protein